MQKEARFVDSDLWRQLLERTDSVDASVFSLVQEAAVALTEADLRDLLERVESGSGREQDWAISMFQNAIRGSNNRLEPLLPELRDKCVQIAEGWTIEDPPPPTDKDAVFRWARARFKGNLPPNVPQSAYFLLAGVDQEAAAQFLVSHFDYETLSAYGKEQVIGYFADLCSRDKNRSSETALRRLIEIAQNGETHAKKACAYLIGRAFMRRSEVEKLTERWRATPREELRPSAIAEFLALEARLGFKSSGPLRDLHQEEQLVKHASDWLATKSFAALERLYNDFICRLPEGTSLPPLLGILGAPDWWGPQHPYVYNFSSEEGPELLVQLTTDGKLGGHKLG